MDVISFTVCLGSKTIFTLQIRYSILTVFPDFKDFQEIKKNHNNTETNKKKKISAQTIKSSTDHAQNYHKN